MYLLLYVLLCLYSQDMNEYGKHAAREWEEALYYI